MPQGQKETLEAYGQEVRDGHARGIFNEYAGMPERTLGSYLSILTNAGGLGLWSNPAVAHATSRTDWNFGDFRRRGHALYLCAPTNDLKVLAPLIRLILGQAVASLLASEPGPDEPLPVMLMVDEFDQLGRMDLFVESMKTLRGHGGRVMVVTQSIPGLDAIYGEDQRRSIEAAAGIKLYITPQDAKTARELSKAIGNRTKLRQSVSRKERDGFAAHSNISLSEEAHPLLSEQDARRLDPEAVIILPAGQQPIKARRIKYFEDRRLAKIYDAQTGPLPHEAIRPADTIAALTNQRIVHTEAALDRERARADSLQQALDRVGDRVKFIEDAFNRSVRSIPEAKAEPASDVESDPDNTPDNATSLISEIDGFSDEDLMADAVSMSARDAAKMPG